MDMPSFRDEDDPRFLWVWDGGSGEYVRTDTQSKPKPYPHRIDNDMFNPATQLEQPKNPLEEGIYAAIPQRQYDWGAHGPEPCPNCMANALRPNAEGVLDCGICHHKFIEDQEGRLQPAPGSVGGNTMLNPFEQDTPGHINNMVMNAGAYHDPSTGQGGYANTGDVICNFCGKRTPNQRECENCERPLTGTEQPVSAGFTHQAADPHAVLQAVQHLFNGQSGPGAWVGEQLAKPWLGQNPLPGGDKGNFTINVGTAITVYYKAKRLWQQHKNKQEIQNYLSQQGVPPEDIPQIMTAILETADAIDEETAHLPLGEWNERQEDSAKRRAVGSQICPECGAEGMREHRPDCSLGRLQNEFKHRPIENFKTEPFNDKVERANPLRTDDSFPSTISNVKDSMDDKPNLDECPDCQGHMNEKGDNKVCANCGKKQPIVYAKTSGLMDALKTVAPLALLAIPGVGEVAAPAAMAAEGAGAAAAGGETAAGAAGLMSGAMNAGKGMAQLAVQPGLAGAATRHELMNAIPGGGGQPSGPQAPEAPTDIQSQLYSNTIPMEHIYYSYDVGPATPINGDDVNPEMDGQYGNQLRSGDSPELFKDQSGEAGGTDSLKGLEARFPLVDEFFNSEKAGRGHPVLEQLHNLLTKTLHGYKHYYDQLQLRHANMPMQPMVPGQQMGAQPNNFNNTSPTPNLTPGPCPICGQGHDAQHCPQASATPGAGLNPGVQPRMTKYISFVEKIAARRPRMCAYHSDLTDYSLTLGDPSSALTALQPNSYGHAWCKSGDYTGNKCNFKPDFLQQEYWDARDAEAQERANQRQLEQQQLEVQQAQEPVAETSEPVEVMPDMGGHAPDISGGESAVQGMPMAANVKTAEDFRDYGDESLPPDDVYGEPCPMCGAENAPMGQLGQRTHYRCRNCGADYSDQDQQHVHNNFADPSGESLNQYRGKTAANPLWTDNEGNPLVPGHTYDMMASNYSIPDKVTIENANHPHKLDVIIEAAGRKLRKEITRDDIAHNTISFKHDLHQVTEPAGLEPHTLEQKPDSYTHGDPVEQDDLSNDTNAAHQDSSTVSMEPAMAKVARKNFSPNEQKEFINEHGSARNLDKLNLEGTHYTQIADLDDYFALGG